MKNKLIWVSVLLMVVSLILSVFTIVHSTNTAPQRYPLFGLLPCIIGFISFLYVNKVAEKKTVFLWFTQLMNIAFMVFPLVTLLYLMTVI